MYREGFEVVLFLQALRLRYGSGVVLEGVVFGLVLVAVIAYLAFGLQRRLPYRRMLVATGVMLGVVLLVMVGESVQEMQQAGWIGITSLHVAVPGWMGLWFSIFPNVQTVVAQSVGGGVRARLLLPSRGAEGAPPAAARDKPRDPGDGAAAAASRRAGGEARERSAADAHCALIVVAFARWRPGLRARRACTATA